MVGLAERIAAEAARIAEECIREMFEITEFDPDEVLGFMTSEEAAEFLWVPFTMPWTFDPEDLIHLAFQEPPD